MPNIISINRKFYLLSLRFNDSVNKKGVSNLTETPFVFNASFTTYFYTSSIQKYKVVVKFIQFDIAVFVDFAS